MTRRVPAQWMVVVLLAGCGASDDSHEAVVAGGDVRRGRAALERHDCGVCHIIPGVRGAPGRVGPSLADLAHRPNLAGKFATGGESLVRWIIDPPAMAPHTAMPAVGVPEADARDMAAYLLALQ
jgi:cytochrome c